MKHEKQLPEQSLVLRYPGLQLHSPVFVSHIPLLLQSSSVVQSKKTKQIVRCEQCLDLKYITYEYFLSIQVAKYPES